MTWPKWLRSAGLFGSLGAALMAWGVIDYERRRDAVLGGRVAVEAPAWAATHYVEVCRLAGRCEARWRDIRWFAVDSTALPAVICPGANAQYREVTGCWDWDTSALTLVRAAYADTVTVRHELLHAALGARYTGQHPCRWYAVANRTLAPGALCE